MSASIYFRRIAEGTRYEGSLCFLCRESPGHFTRVLFWECHDAYDAQALSDLLLGSFRLFVEHKTVHRVMVTGCAQHWLRLCDLRRLFLDVAVMRDLRGFGLPADAYKYEVEVDILKRTLPLFLHQREAKLRRLVAAYQTERALLAGAL